MAKVIITLEDNEEGGMKVETVFDPALKPSKGVSLAQNYGLQIVAAVTSSDRNDGDDDE